MGKKPFSWISIVIAFFGKSFIWLRNGGLYECLEPLKVQRDYCSSPSLFYQNSCCFLKVEYPLKVVAFLIFFKSLDALQWVVYQLWATLLTSELRFWEDTPKINMSFIGFYFPAKRSARIWKESDFGTISGALKQADSVSYVQTKERGTNSDRIT